MFKKPQLASWVQSFSIAENYSTPEEGLVPLEAWAKDEDAEKDKWARRGWPEFEDLDLLIENAVSNVGFKGEEKEKRIALVKEGNDESIILATLLPNLTNLERLDLGHGGIFDDSDLLVNLFQKIGKGDPTFEKSKLFSNLSEMLIAGTDTKYPNGETLLGVCVALPAIKSIYGLALGESEQTELTPSIAELRAGFLNSRIPGTTLLQVCGPKIQLDQKLI